MKLNEIYVWFGAVVTLVVVFLMFHISSTAAFAGNVDPRNLAKIQVEAPLFQTPVPTDEADDENQEEITPTDSVTSTNRGAFETRIISFSDLNYETRTLQSPFGSDSFSIRLPSNWILQEGGFVELDLSYRYNYFEPLDEAEGLPATLGQLFIDINGQPAESLSITDSELNHRRLRIPFPAAIIEEINADDRRQPMINISITFDIGLCNVSHKARLTVHPTSYILINYNETELVPDLSVYPLPFYQNSLDEDIVRFGLPSQVSVAEANGIVSTAAKLGGLTRNRLVISSTLDSNLVEATSSNNTELLEEHIFVIGRPQNNSFLRYLNQLTDLPVSFRERQMRLTTEGPTAISVGEVFTYTFTVENTLDQTTNISVRDMLPHATEMVNCSPQCDENSSNRTIAWESSSLEAGETKDFTLALQVTKLITTVLYENTVMLTEDDLGLVNVDTLLSDIDVEASDFELQTSATVEKGPFFFTIGNQAVSEYDGIIQEIISPWNENRAILILTGLNEDAIRKATHTLSSETRFPGLNGSFVLIQEALPPDLEEPIPLKEEMTLADLGYDDQVTQSRFPQKFDYDFFLPQNWLLTNEANVSIYFQHSQLLEDQISEISVLFNRRPIGNIVITDESESEGVISADLPPSAAKPGKQNIITIQVTPPGTTGCMDGTSQESWMVVQKESAISLDYQEGGEILDLNLYPLPFNHQSTLADLILSLPEQPSPEEWQDIINLGTSLGNASGGETILPKVIMGQDIPEEELENYHVIALGRPTRNPLIQEANSKLPQPFLPNSDEIQQQLDDVILRLPPGIALGYVQLLVSPWNEDRAFLAVTGTTDEGFAWASQALSVNEQMSGNLALIRETEIESIDTRGLLSADVATIVLETVPEMTQTTTITSPVSAEGPVPTPTRTPRIEEPERPIWLIPLVVATIIAVIAILGFAYIQSRK